MYRNLFFVFVFMLQGCTIDLMSRPSQEELARIKTPPPHIKQRIDTLLPKVVAWYTQAQKHLRSKGRVLSPKERIFAKSLGIKQINRIRIVTVDAFPQPEDAQLQEAAKRYGFDSPYAGGLTLGHTVLIKKDFLQNPVIVPHELVHVAQVERMGLKSFLRRYLTELEVVGYRKNTLEIEAYKKQGKLSS